MSNRILVIDDEAQIRRLLQINLEHENYSVILASTAREGAQMAASHQPHLILLDLGLPDKSGHELLKELRVWYNNPIVILSVLNSEADIVSALDHGATDYLTKPFRSGELMARIRSALRNTKTEQASSTIRAGFFEIDLTAHLAKREGKILKLTTTEFNLLVLLMRNEGRVLTHQFLLKEVWGTGYQTETQYLRVYMAQLRKKIEVNPNQPVHIITESGIGYRFQS
ncbi:MAG: response regulator transcription factor [Cyclobacteriaceae bacterium]|nr:response regulator transcription factor [Cyclobacteriaceae bacterium]